jgi:hypothetical protein
MYKWKGAGEPIYPKEEITVYRNIENQEGDRD